MYYTTHHPHNTVSVTREEKRKENADHVDDYDALPPTSTNTSEMRCPTCKRSEIKRRTFNHNIDRVYRIGSVPVCSKQNKTLTIVLHVERQWCIILAYPVSIVQKPVYMVSIRLTKTKKKRTECSTHPCQPLTHKPPATCSTLYFALF